MVDITYDHATVLYNSADIAYDGNQKDTDKWGWGQDFEAGTDVTTASSSGTWSFIGSRSQGGQVNPSFTMTFPVGTLDGDLILTALVIQSGTFAQVPSGWSQVGPALSVTTGGQTRSLTYYYKAVDGDTTAVFSWGGVSPNFHSVTVTFRNSAVDLRTVDLSALSTWYEFADTHALHDAASGGTITVGSAANSVINNLGLYIIGVVNSTPSSNTYTDPSNVTLARRGQTDAAECQVSVYYEIDSDGWPSTVWTNTWPSGGQSQLAGRGVVDVASDSHESDTWQVF